MTFIMKLLMQTIWKGLKGIISFYLFTRSSSSLLLPHLIFIECRATLGQEQCGTKERLWSDIHNESLQPKPWDAFEEFTHTQGNHWVQDRRLSLFGAQQCSDQIHLERCFSSLYKVPVSFRPILVELNADCIHSLAPGNGTNFLKDKVSICFSPGKIIVIIRDRRSRIN